MFKPQEEIIIHCSGSIGDPMHLIRFTLRYGETYVHMYGTRWQRFLIRLLLRVTRKQFESIAHSK